MNVINMIMTMYHSDLLGSPDHLQEDAQPRGHRHRGAVEDLCCCLIMLTWII